MSWFGKHGIRNANRVQIGNVLHCIWKVQIGNVLRLHGMWNEALLNMEQIAVYTEWVGGHRECTEWYIEWRSMEKGTCSMAYMWCRIHIVQYNMLKEAVWNREHTAWNTEWSAIIGNGQQGTWNDMVWYRKCTASGMRWCGIGNL